MERICALVGVYFVLILYGFLQTCAAKDEIIGIRLSYPSDPDIHYKGKVEIQINYDPEWYDICYDGSDDANHQSWNRAAATVACRQLTFQAGWKGSRRGISSKFTFEGFVCSDYTSQTLNDCSYDDKEGLGCGSKTYLWLDHFQQAHAFVECYNLEDTMIRLNSLNSSSINHSGKLEVMYRGEWYDVCYRGTSSSHDWNIHNANVTCNQLGYSLGAVETSPLTSRTSRSLSFDDFRCSGDEDNLFSCFPDPPNDSACGEGNQVFIVCKESREAIEGVTNSVVIGSVIGVVVVLVIVVAAILFIVIYIRKRNTISGTIPPQNTDNTTPHSNAAFQTIDNGYADIQNGGPQDNYTYAYADVTRGNPEPTQSETNRETRRDVGDNDNVEEWADNIAYVSYGNENVQHSETRDGDGWTENKIYGD